MRDISEYATSPQIGLKQFFKNGETKPTKTRTYIQARTHTSSFLAASMVASAAIRSKKTPSVL